MEERQEQRRDGSSEEESELSLSCGSSLFDDGNNGSDDGLENEVEEATSAVAGASMSEASNTGINPYQFEPYASDSVGSDGDDSDGNEDRLADNSWCTCGNCQVIPTARECVCCNEIERVVDVKNAFANTQCITHHPGFSTVCLDVHVLKVAYYQYRQHYGNRPEQENEQNRYTAYRQFVRLCLHFLGKEICVVIPACAVLKIRNTFQNQNYTGFHQADSD